MHIRCIFFVVLFGFEFYFESVVYGIQDFRFLKIIGINKRKQLHVFLVVVRFIHNAIKKI